MNKQLKKIVEDRDIKWLFHFTRAENIPNIFSYGLLSVENLEALSIDFYYNDSYRYDKCRNAVCTSIQFPNYKMFYPLRLNNPGVEWVVLKLDASILYELDCAFCITNAGSGEVYNIPITERMGAEAFNKLFDDYPSYPLRQQLGISDRCPTNPQAEVLVFNTIPINYIKSVYFKDSHTLHKFEEYIPENINATVNSKVFIYRSDYEYWR